jgi:hypothetical protein
LHSVADYHGGSSNTTWHVPIFVNPLLDRPWRKDLERSVWLLESRKPSGGSGLIPGHQGRCYYSLERGGTPPFVESIRWPRLHAVIRRWGQQCATRLLHQAGMAWFCRATSKRLGFRGHRHVQVAPSSCPNYRAIAAISLNHCGVVPDPFDYDMEKNVLNIIHVFPCVKTPSTPGHGATSHRFSNKRGHRSQQAMVTASLSREHGGTVFCFVLFSPHYILALADSGHSLCIDNCTKQDARS